MTDPASSWFELRYRSAQPLPGTDGIRDELDGVVIWHVDAVRCFHLEPDQLVGGTDVAVFDLASGLDLRTPAALLGDGIAKAAALVLDDDGRLRPELGDVDAFVLFQQVVISDALRGQGLAATLAIRDRTASRRALVGCLPDPPSLDPAAPGFFDGVPAPAQQPWWDRGLRHLADGLWLLPPDSRG